MILFTSRIVFNANERRKESSEGRVSGAMPVVELKHADTPEKFSNG